MFMEPLSAAQFPDLCNLEELFFYIVFQFFNNSFMKQLCGFLI